MELKNRVETNKTVTHSCPIEEDINFKYMKHVLIKFLTSSEYEVSFYLPVLIFYAYNNYSYNIFLPRIMLSNYVEIVGGKKSKIMFILFLKEAENFELLKYCTVITPF